MSIKNIFSASLLPIVNGICAKQKASLLRLCMQLLVVFPFCLSAKDVNLKTAITDVTVFQSGAQVKRTGSVTIPAGEHEIKITDATALLVKESIQVKGEGNFTILSVNHQMDFEKTDQQKSKWPVLEAKQKDLMRRMEELSVKIQVLNSEETTMNNLQQITTQTKGVTVEQISKAQETVRLRLTEIKQQKLNYSRQVLNLFDEYKAVTQQLVSLKTEKQSVSYAIVVKVVAKAETKGEFTVTYVVPNARWYPTYDLRVKDVSSPMTIEYKANVSQESGEDWNNVSLKLSTGDPSQSSQKPVIEAWRLYLNQNYVQPYRANNFYRYTDARFTHVKGAIVNAETGTTIPWCTVWVSGTNIGTTADAEGNFSLVLPQDATSLQVMAIGYQAQTVNIDKKNLIVKLYQQYMPLNETVKTDYERQLMTVQSPVFSTDYEQQLYSVNVPVDPVITNGMYNLSVTDANAASYSYGYANAEKSYDKVQRLYGVIDSKKLEAAKIPEVSKTLNVVSTEFSIAEKYTILSDPKSIAVAIENITAPAHYQYYCAPRLDPDVFLTAQLVNWEQYNLLEGQANVFYEGTFIGNTFLDTRYLVDTLEISLGRDKSIKVERNKSKEYKRKEALGNDITDYRHWDIAVRNSKSQNIDIIIEDQFPISSDSRIEVTQEEKSGGALDEKTGIVTWDLKQLESSKTKNIALRYKVRYPKGNFIGLD